MSEHLQPRPNLLTRRTTKLVAAGVAGVLTLGACSGGSTSASPDTSPRPSTAKTTSFKLTPGMGYDVSWPQCGDAPLPDPADFAIVGINGNLPSEFNPCYDQQAAWAKQSSGASELPRFMGYVTAASPGNIVPSWPTTGSNKYGDCNGDNSPACAYGYGQMRAELDIESAANNIPPILFIDVEPEYSWDVSPDLNTATLDGMGDTFHNAGIQVGVYSTSGIWNTVTGGGVDKGHSLAGAPVWMLGGHNDAEVTELCSQPSFTGGPILLVQIAAANGGTEIDQNYTCPS